MKFVFSLNKSHRTTTGENNERISIGKKTYEVSVGESVKIIRELQGLSQNELAALTGIPQSTLSTIKHDKINLGIERAKILARALKCHPAVLVFPGWDIEAAV
jgi:ribosome-binding protein aMBF1 (putative translation factor)